MGYCYQNFSKPKRYIQFNDLVFYGTKSIDEQTESLSLRENKVPRTFYHGSYVANRGEKSLIGDNTISLKIALSTNNWSEEHVQAHYDFILDQLMTPGKLWAINTGLKLIWCNAYVTSIQPAKEWVITDDDYLVFSVELDNPDGVWYRADENKVFFEEYDNCDFIDLKASCLGQNRYCCSEPLVCNQHCECCESKCKDMEHMINMCEATQNPDFFNLFFDDCISAYRVVYNCEKLKQEGRPLNELYPHTICDYCIKDSITGNFVSTTTLESHKWSFAIMGTFHDPILQVNGVDIEITGDYKGVLTFDYRGVIRTAPSWECIEYAYEEVPLDKWKLCSDKPVIKKGTNTVSLYGIVGESACIYINYESVTI